VTFLPALAGEAVPWPGSRRLTSRRDIKRGIAGQDALMEPLQIRSRFDAKFGGEPGARLAKHGERVGLPAAAVAGEHQQPDQPLPQRVLRHRGRQPGDRVLMAPAVKQRREPVFRGIQPLFLQPGSDLLRPDGPRDVGQRRPLPQRQRLIDFRHRKPPVSRQAGVRRHPAEPVHVHPLAINVQAVTVSAPCQARVRNPAKCLAQPGDQYLDAVACRARRVGIPHGAGQVFRRHDAPGLQGQQPEYQALLRRARRQPLPTAPCPDRSKQPEVDLVSHPGPSGYENRICRSIICKITQSQQVVTDCPEKP
jgi:hypothetical protein